MDIKETLLTSLTDFVNSSAGNRVSEEDAIYPRLAGMQIYDAPIMGFAAADDTLFTETFKQESVR